jgi:hypothetical protein
MNVEYLTETAGGPLVRFAGDVASVKSLRGVFDRLAGGQQAIGLDFLTSGDTTVEFRDGPRGGMCRVSGSAFVFDGDRSQRASRARLLDPLTRPPAGFQHLDYEGAGEVGVVVTTYPDGGF